MYNVSKQKGLFDCCLCHHVPLDDWGGKLLLQLSPLPESIPTASSFLYVGNREACSVNLALQITRHTGLVQETW